jgi:radical SAM superfamily enzyme YgiQ (UPF0313 family)
MNRPRVLLVNPTMTARRNARFPLSLLALAQSLEGTHAVTLIDGNVDRDTSGEVKRALEEGPFAAVGVTVMGGPQVRSAIDVSRTVRAASPSTPIIWGGYFPSLYPATALNASYVDYAVRGQGEDTFGELLAHLGSGQPDHAQRVAGVSFRAGAIPVHNADRVISAPRVSTLGSYALLGDPRRYLARTVLGARTVAHQGAVGCRFRCTFCGVASMFRGATHLPPAELLAEDLAHLKLRFDADSVQFYDHNFFDREQEMLPLLEVLARAELPWWCYARADALIGLSAEAWALVRRSRLKMAYIGAESPNDQLLREIRKGTRADQTLEVAELCRRHGVIPELSFMVAPPVDPEAETERTFEFIRQVKRVNPASEIIVYIYTPLPPESVPARLRPRLTPLQDADGTPLRFPSTPEEWTERRWIDYACHADAPWLSESLRRRIRDFVTVLKCRFPTVQDTRTPRWAASVLKATAAWRYRLRRYDRPWELDLARRVIPLGDPQTTSL